jgi:hypothetical protein
MATARALIFVWWVILANSVGKMISVKDMRRILFPLSFLLAYLAWTADSPAQGVGPSAASKFPYASVDDFVNNAKAREDELSKLPVPGNEFLLFTELAHIDNELRFKRPIKRNPLIMLTPKRRDKR